MICVTNSQILCSSHDFVPSSILQDCTLHSSAFPSTFRGYKKNTSMARRALRNHSMLFSVSFDSNMYQRLVCIYKKNYSCSCSSTYKRLAKHILIRENLYVSTSKPLCVLSVQLTALPSFTSAVSIKIIQRKAYKIHLI